MTTTQTPDLTTLYRGGRFYLIDTDSHKVDYGFGSFASIAEAKTAAGARFDASYVPDES